MKEPYLIQHNWIFRRADKENDEVKHLDLKTAREFQDSDVSEVRALGMSRSEEVEKIGFHQFCFRAFGRQSMVKHDG